MLNEIPMNLREQLKEILPRILPKSPAESIKGTQLIEIVKSRLNQDYSDATLRYHFSVMSCDPSSPIAKVDQGQGYYLRLPGTEEIGRLTPRLRQEALRGFDHDNDSPEQIWLKFQAFYERFATQDTTFSFTLHHLPHDGELPRSHFWTVPDSVLVKWKSGQPNDQGTGFRLVPELLTLEAPGFELSSVKLATAVTPHNYRRVFFQCLSSCSWAHAAELVIATQITEHYIVDDLRSLGQRHGVGVSYFSFKESTLEKWSNPSLITSMPTEGFDKALRDGARFHRITAAQPNSQLDWGHLGQIDTNYPAIQDLFRWVHYCLMQKQAISFDDFDAASRR